MIAHFLPSYFLLSVGAINLDELTLGGELAPVVPGLGILFDLPQSYSESGKRSFLDSIKGANRKLEGIKGC